MGSVKDTGLSRPALHCGYPVRRRPLSGNSQDYQALGSAPICNLHFSLCNLQFPLWEFPAIATAPFFKGGPTLTTGNPMAPSLTAALCFCYVETSLRGAILAGSNC